MVNRREFDYLVEHELYNLEGQAEFVRTHTIEFPVNDDTTHGAIEIKLAGKFLTDAEIASNRFLTRQLPVVSYRPAALGAADSVPLRTNQAALQTMTALLLVPRRRLD